METVRLIYTSRVADDFDPADLVEILKSARDRNHEDDITGVLFLTTEYFIQCLEGPRDAVNALYIDLSKDNRHSDLVILDYTDINKREFSSWRMAYVGPDKISQNLLEKHCDGPVFDPYTMNRTMANALLVLLTKFLDEQGEAEE